METILIDIKIDDAEVAQKLSAVKLSLTELKKSNSDMRKEMRQTGDATGELSAAMARNEAQIKALTATEKSLSAQIQHNDKENRKYGDSFTEQAAKLAQLKKEYSGLSAAQRDSAAGKEMLKNLQSLDKQVKANSASMGNFQANVGNYTSAFGAFGQKAQQIAGIFAGGFVNGLKTAGRAVVKFGVTLLTTPIGWIAAALAAVAAVLKKVADAFKKSDDAGTALSRALSVFKPIVTAIRTAFDALANALAKVAGWYAKLAEKMLSVIPGFKAAREAADELVVAEDNLQEAQRKYTVEEAERAKEIARLNREIRSGEKYTAEERKRMAEEADALALKNVEARKKNVAEELRIMKGKAAQEKDTSDKTKDAIAAKTAELFRAEEEYYRETTRLASQKAAAEKQAAKELEESLKKQRELRLKALETQKEILAQVVDAQLASIRDEKQRSRAEIILQYTREIEALEERLQKEKNLTAKAREAINELILLKQREFNNRLAAFDEALSEERAAEEVKRMLLQEENILRSKKLQVRRNALQIAELELEFSGMRLKRVEEMSEESWKKEFTTAQEWEKKILELRETYAAAAEAVEREKAAAIAAGIDIKLEKVKAEITSALEDIDEDTFAGERDKNAAELDAARERLDIIKNLSEEEYLAKYESVEAWKEAVIDAGEEVKAAEKNIADTTVKQWNTVTTAAADWSQAFETLFEAVAGDSHAFAVFQKALSIVNLTIKAAEAVAGAVAAATAGDPYTLPVRIAAAAAAVAAALAGVIAAVKESRVPDKPKFGGGGIVGGDSYHGDQVPALVNSGEMILTREQQGALFKLITGSVAPAAAAGVDYKKIAQALQKAVRELPAPVMVYAEYLDFKETRGQIIKIKDNYMQ